MARVKRRGEPETGRTEAKTKSPPLNTPQGWDGGWARFSGCCPESPILCPYEGLGKKRTAKSGCPTGHAMGRRLGTIYRAPTCQMGEGLLFENVQQSNHRATGPSHG